MYMTSAARIADTIAAGARKEIGAASSFQEMNMSAFPRHTGAMSRKRGYDYSDDYSEGYGDCL